MPEPIVWQDNLIRLMDDVLIAITDGYPVPEDRLRSLPPWRAILMARVAVKAGAYQEEHLEALVEEARKVTGIGHLSGAWKYWDKP